MPDGVVTHQHESAHVDISKMSFSKFMKCTAPSHLAACVPICSTGYQLKADCTSFKHVESSRTLQEFTRRTFNKDEFVNTFAPSRCFFKISFHSGQNFQHRRNNFSVTLGRSFVTDRVKSYDAVCQRPGASILRPI